MASEMRADVRLLHDQGLVAEQAEARRIGPAQIALRHQLVLVEAALRDRRAACRRETRRVPRRSGYSSLVMPMPCSPEITPFKPRAMPHDARHRAVRGVQHGVVVGVHRNVGVHVAVAGVHVQGDEYAALQNALVHGVALGEHRRESRADEDARQARRAPRSSSSPGCCDPAAGRRRCPPHRLRRRSRARPESRAPRPRLVHGVEQVLPARAHAAPAARALPPGAPMSTSAVLPRLDLAGRSIRRARRAARSLLRIDSSILMRSMASVYSPRRSSGMTTSSLILKALVCLAIAAVLARSSQNLRRASAFTAMKPSPERALARRTTCEVAAATASRRPRRRYRRAAPSSAARRASIWCCSRPRASSARPDARGRRACAPLALACRLEVALDLHDARESPRAPGRRIPGTPCAYVCGMRCKIQRAAVIRPSQPSFCTPGKPPRNLSVTSLPSPDLAKLRALDVEPLAAQDLGLIRRAARRPSRPARSSRPARRESCRRL